jgi:hypothetical protein
VVTSGGADDPPGIGHKTRLRQTAAGPAAGPAFMHPLRRENKRPISLPGLPERPVGGQPAVEAGAAGPWGVPELWEARPGEIPVSRLQGERATGETELPAAGAGTGKAKCPDRKNFAG